jgi:hypothetical protein
MKKNIFYAFLMLITVSACSPATKVERTWASPDKNSYGYNNLFVAAIVSDITIRRAIENDIQKKLSAQSVTSTTSNSTIRPDFWNSTDLDKNAMMKVVYDSKKDAIMTLSIVDKQNEQRYIPGAMMMGGPMMMGPGWGMGGMGGFGGFWGMNHGMMMTPGHIVNDKTYFVEINVYDTKSELLVWTAQSATTNPGRLEKASQEFAKVVINRMVREGVLKK